MTDTGDRKENAGYDREEEGAKDGRSRKIAVKKETLKVFAVRNARKVKAG